MNEKSIYFIFGLCIFILLSCCKSTEPPIDSVVAGNSYTVGRIERAVDTLEGTTISSRERIKDIIQYSEGLTDGIERLEYLFGEYEQEVERLLREIDSVRTILKEETNDIDCLRTDTNSSNYNQGINFDS